MFVIGIDPHKGSHTAAVIDRDEELVARFSVVADRLQRDRLLGWAREFAPKILVNAVAPGPIDTPLLNFDKMSPEQQAIELRNPLGRIGRPEEIASVIVFLAGAGASFITGQCFSADGGAAMH